MLHPLLAEGLNQLLMYLHLELMLYHILLKYLLLDLKYLPLEEGEEEGRLKGEEEGMEKEDLHSGSGTKG